MSKIIQKIKINTFKESKFLFLINNSENAKTLLRNSFWSLFGSIVSKGLLFLSWVVVARIIGSEGYGQFGIIRSTVLMFTTFAGFSLGITATKYVAEFIHHDKEKTERILGITMLFAYLLGFSVSLIFYFLSPWLAKYSLDAPQLTNELRITSIALFFSAVNGAQTGALQGFMDFKTIAVINLLQSIISFPLFYFGALYFGVHGTIWAFILSYVIICVFSFIAIRMQLKKNQLTINYKNCFKEKDILIAYSLPSFISGFMITPVKWYSDSILVTKSSFSEMGIFTAAFTINNMVLLGAGMLSGPFLSILLKNKNSSKESKLSRFNIIAPWAIGSFISCPFLIFPELGYLIFGSTFANTKFTYVFAIVILFTIIIMYRDGLTRLLIVHNLQWWGVLDNLIWSIVLIFTFLSFNSKDSLALSISYLVAYIINTIIFIPFYTKRKLLPEKIVISRYALFIWMLIILLFFVGIIKEYIYFKTILLLIVYLLLYHLFKNLVLKENFKTSQLFFYNKIKIR